MRKIITLIVLLLIVNGLNAQYSKDTLIQSVTQSCFLGKRNFTALDLINREAHHIPLSDLKKRKTVPVHISICLPYIINPALLSIRDGQDASVLPGATVTFVSSDKRDTLMYVADSLGKVGLNELNKMKRYTVRVSSSGYLTFTGLLSDQVTGEIKLERDFKTGPAVVISSFHSIGCCRGCGGGHKLRGQDCGMQLALIPDKKLTDSLSQLVATGIRVYPNPVQRGQLIHLRLLQGYFPEGRIQVLSLDGRNLLSVPLNAGKKQGQVWIPTEQRWAAGIYIFQMVYANGQVGASEKVILQ